MPEQTSTGQIKENEPVLPELKLTQLVKSPRPLVELSPVTRGMVTIRPWGEYTIVIGKGKSKIQVLDKAGRDIEEFSRIGSTMIVDWPKIKESLGGGSLKYLDLQRPANFSGIRQDDTTYVTSLPVEIQTYAESLVKATGQGWMNYPEGAEKIDLSEVVIDIDVTSAETYVLIFDKKNKRFIAYLTQNDQGISQPPRNWKRVDVTSMKSEDFPYDCAVRINTLKSGKDDYLVAVGSSYYAAVTDTEFKVCDVAKTKQPALDKKVFSDKISKVGRNVCVDPRNPNIVYYCSGTSPTSISKLDLSQDFATLQTESSDLPNVYKSVDNLQLDPSGNFFLFGTDEGLVVLSKDTLQEVKKVPRLFEVNFDAQGKIRGIDEKGHLVIYDVNFQEVSREVEKRKLARIAQGLATDLFKKEGSTATKEEVDQFEHLLSVKTDLETKFNTQLQKAASLDEVSDITEALVKLRTRLKSEGLDLAQVEFIAKGITGLITAREHSLAVPVVSQGLSDLSAKLSGNLTLATIAEAREGLAKIKSLEGLVDDAARAQIRTLENQLDTQSAELFKREGTVIGKDVGSLVDGVRVELEQMASMPDFADWQEFRLPQLVSRLGLLANDCPLEAHETQKKILTARRHLQELSREYEIKFKEKYAQVREKASQVLGERIELMRTDMDSLADRLRARGFKDRTQAEIYINSSQALEVLKIEITQLSKQNPDAGRELDRQLKVKLAAIMSEIERGGLTSIAETGQQMVLFGNAYFPRWEGKVREKIKRQIDLIFIPDERTKGPLVTADQILGDVGMMEINSRGKLEKRRLYQGVQKEDEWRYGSVSYRSEYVFPSYVSQAEYRKIKAAYADWNKGKGELSEIKQTLNEKRQALHEWYQQRQKPNQRDSQADELWAARYKELLEDYSKFSARNYALLLSRIDQLRKAPETTISNGVGFVPEGLNHWTVDETTEGHLEEMAQASKMQLDLQEGILVLKGHAGTGKDVLVKMFCSRTNRPYFSIDCSKWTTEFELSEDVVLEAEDGASKTVKVPSVVLNAITTPGAVMYFNEINAMPEQAQIFLHGLTDEKRTLTLKTSSGKAIRADKTVILMGSMNPGYPGTFNPQFATRSRMMGLEIGYPPLYREKDQGDPNPNPPLSASEALRVARQVDSLSDFTYEENPKHNEFVKIWDRYVNGIQNGAPDLTSVQRFDIEAILTMVEFAQKLREGFILRFEKRSASEIKGKLTVDQPITGREMRRMAYFLSKMPEEEKATANPEAVVRNLINKFFLSHIDNQKEKDEVKTAMATWTSFRRPAA